MIPILTARALGAITLGLVVACGAAPGPSPATGTSGPQAPTKGDASACLSSGDGYLRATVAGAVETHIDWPNSGTHCDGESRDSPPGVRLSFHREGANPDLLLVFGLSGVTRGEPARQVGANLTVIVQGTSRIFGTLGDSRCTIDTLSQRPLPVEGTYRVEARGFCTQPAHAVRGAGDVLVSTFEFAGPVTYLPPATDEDRAAQEPKQSEVTL
jgi:hypothetical protein